MDPISCVALATGAYKTLKAAISTGQDLQSMGNSLATSIRLRKGLRTLLGGKRLSKDQMRKTPF
jgi:hypothetical protein